MADAAFVA
jgi:hypothetical protein